jgi:hypothetical protein
MATLPVLTAGGRSVIAVVVAAEAVNVPLVGSALDVGGRPGGRGCGP